jgi:glycine cleavage system H protein
MSSKVPADLKYTKSHEWVRLEGNVATVGITDHAQQELTDIVFVELPAAGRQLKAGEPCAVVESVKTASDVYAPLSGEVISVNAAVTKTPALVNDQPYEAGWFYKVKLSNPAELAGLLAPADYSTLIGQ